MLEAVVFDFDGVIADSEPLHLAAFRRALEPRAIAVSDADYYDRYVGFDDRDGFRAILADRSVAADDATIEALCRAKARAFAELAAAESEPFAGVRELVVGLAAAPPVPLAIASGALHVEVDTLLVRFGLDGFFEAVIAADDVAASKPDPESYRAALAALARRHGPLDPARCVAIEDTPTGLAAARAAGMRTLAVETTHAASALEADSVVATLAAVDRAQFEDLVAAGGGEEGG